MKTKNIFKALAVAMLLPAMLLTTACSNDDDAVNNDNTAKNGYPLQVTVNVTREGDGGTTRATFDGSKLNFSSGDMLFVKGSHATAGEFAGTLEWKSGGTFSGTIYTANTYSSTADALFSSATTVNATLLPNGYGSHSYLSTTGSGYSTMLIQPNINNTFATTKALAVEQYSYEYAGGYSSGFALHPQNAILNFTITGLTASTLVTATLTKGDPATITISGSVTTDGYGKATFAMALGGGADLNDFSLTVGGNAVTLVSSSTSAAAGKIYNIARSITNLGSLLADYTAQNGETLTGTLTGNYKISIADGATVTLDGVTITNLGNGCDWAGINCPGDATIILKGDNEVCSGWDDGGYTNFPGIWIATGKTLNIMGDGSLTASSGASGASDPCGAGIGGGFEIDCGNINISGGTINATGGDMAACIGGGCNASCGNITITSGVTRVTATKGYEAPNSIGAGGGSGTCGTVTIGGIVTGNITTSPYTYPEP